jgi:alcohol/geraniol dehydrogenase (NADP+)
VQLEDVQFSDGVTPHVIPSAGGISLLVRIQEILRAKRRAQDDVPGGMVMGIYEVEKKESSMIVHAYAALHAKGPLKPFDYSSEKLAVDEVEVTVSHCGICHSDVHMVDDNWAITTFPLVPGHEIIGVVAAVGSTVERFKVGQRVGIGWQCSSCLTCENCRRGEENLCSKSQGVIVGHHGGFAGSVRAHERFVIPIPDALQSENAAPLLCGGVTVYSPLRLHQIGPHMKVGIIGIGGLGHLALQFANAFGC